MNIKVCDICLFVDNKMFESKVRTGFRGGKKIDACETHRYWAKGKKEDEFNREVSELEFAYWGRKV